MSGESVSRPDDVFHPNFHHGCPTYFDISVRSALHSGVLTQAAFSSVFTALRGEMEKDVWHQRLVEAAGVFCTVDVDNFVVLVSLWH